VSAFTLHMFLFSAKSSICLIIIFAKPFPKFFLEMTTLLNTMKSYLVSHCPSILVYPGSTLINTANNQLLFFLLLKQILLLFRCLFKQLLHLDSRPAIYYCHLLFFFTFFYSLFQNVPYLGDFINFSFSKEVIFYCNFS
jgi:hypothetical protein